MTEPDDGVDDVDPRAHDALRAFHFMQVTSAQVVAKAAADLGLAPADMRVLYFLTVEPGATPKRVAEHLGLTTGAVTSLVDRLVVGGYAERRPHPTDGRSVILELTGTGRAGAGALESVYSKVFLETIDADDMSALARSLQAIAEALLPKPDPKAEPDAQAETPPAT